MVRWWLWLVLCAVAQGGEPAALLARRGPLLVEEHFAQMPPPYVQKPGVGFASGFRGWRFNTAARGGTWTAVEGAFRGVENPAVKHPATASYGFDFQNVVILAELRLDEPAEARLRSFMAIRTTDEKDYVCSLALAPGEFHISKDDNDHGGPDKAQVLAQHAGRYALGEWHQVTIEIVGEEMTGTVDGVTITGTHALLGRAKKSVMFVAGGQGSVRNFRVYAAEPNPAWPQLKASLPKP